MSCIYSCKHTHTKAVVCFLSPCSPFDVNKTLFNHHVASRTSLTVSFFFFFTVKMTLNNIKRS